MKIDGIGNLCLWCMEEVGEASVCPHCGHISGEVSSGAQCLQPGTFLNQKRYLIGRVLGMGGFGITYLAYDCQMLGKRAIKEYYPQGMVYRIGVTDVQPNTLSKENAFQKGMDSFHKEAMALKKYGAHPNVVKIYDFFQENGTAYLAMDYVEGESFSAYLKSHGDKLGWEETLRLLSPIGDVLSTMHASGLLHRDVKPDNIFITREGTAVLLDFGSARYSHTEGITNSMTAILTPGYAPMEQYGKKHQGSWTDLYAYAATFYRAISGIVPPISTDRADEDTLMPLHQLDSEIPEAVSDAIDRAMAVKISARTQTVAEFLSGFPVLSKAGAAGGSEKALPTIRQEEKADNSETILFSAASDEKANGSETVLFASTPNEKADDSGKTCSLSNNADKEESQEKAVCPVPAPDKIESNAAKSSPRKSAESTKNEKSSDTDHSDSPVHGAGKSKKWLWAVLAVAAAVLVFLGRSVFVNKPKAERLADSSGASEVASNKPEEENPSDSSESSISDSVFTESWLRDSLFTEEKNADTDSYAVWNEKQGGAYWYREASVSSDILGWLPNGTKITLLEDQKTSNVKEWVKIKPENKSEGWILLNNISAEN